MYDKMLFKLVVSLIVIDVICMFKFMLVIVIFMFVDICL